MATEKNSEAPKVKVRTAAPSCPNPHPPQTAEERVEDLRRGLDPSDSVYLPGQRKNIEALIAMYEKGELKAGEDCILLNGKVVTEAELGPGKGATWRETTKPYHQLGMRKVAYGPAENGMFGHEFVIQMRIMQVHGGDGTTKTVRIFNDTGSDVCIVFYSDLNDLGNTTELEATFLQMRRISFVNGTRQVYLAGELEMRLLTEDEEPWGPWFVEQIVLHPDASGVARLSGGMIRNQFFMGTDPKYEILAVAETRGGISSLLGAN